MNTAAAVETMITDMGIRLGITYTDEQREFMSDFTVPTISFSSPGTGKTKAAIGGLIIAESFHGIPGKNIYATSFTRMSTGELQLRHARDCARLGMRQTVNFNTLHSLCLGIIRDNYGLLGMRSFSSGGETPVSVLADTLASISESYGFGLQSYKYRQIIRACNSLNSQLIFDDEHVRDSFVFKQCHVPLDVFKVLRKCLYTYAKLTGKIGTNDILLYTLEILLRFPEVSKRFKEQCRILLVDEFQDLSLLELRIVTLLSDCVIAIGDIKQQIYAFQGACTDIVDEYKKYFPSARVANLNKSFRCGSDIVEYSKKIIAPNEMGEQGFVSMGQQGSVVVDPDLQLSDLCDSIEKDYRENRNTFSRDILFLFRNNYSAVPIAEEFFKRKVPFRVNKYVRATDMPVIKEMLAVISLAVNPSDPANLNALYYVLPEMRDYKDYRQSPLYKIMQKEGCSLFEVNYQFRNAMQARRCMEMLMRIRELATTARPMRELLNTVYPVFQDVWLNDHEDRLDMPSKYYISMVQPLVQTKPFFKFIQDEAAKMQAIEDANARGIGVRCYTFHASKGLEAQDVYMLDCNMGVCPNTRQIDIMEAAGCAVEKARDIRNERCLLFVAATRAKERLIISHSGDISPLLRPYNMYAQYDILYKEHRRTYPDAEAFELFLEFNPTPPSAA